MKFVGHNRGLVDRDWNSPVCSVQHNAGERKPKIGDEVVVEIENKRHPGNPPKIFHGKIREIVETSKDRTLAYLTPRDKKWGTQYCGSRRPVVVTRGGGGRRVLDPERQGRQEQYLPGSAYGGRKGGRRGGS